MKIIADTHTHTVMSGHAHSTLLENITEAKRKGMKFLAVTDHTGIMPGAPHESYFTCMWSAIPDEYDGVYLLRGCEANILDETGTLDVSESEQQPQFSSFGEFPHSLSSFAHRNTRQSPTPLPRQSELTKTAFEPSY